MKNTKKFISLILALLTVISVVSVGFYSLATEAPAEDSRVNDYYDFSEYNMAMSHHIDAPYGSRKDPLNSGGNAIAATTYYARWSGPVNEASDPYPESRSSTNGEYTEYPHLLPIKSVYYYSNEINEIKGALMQYGALNCSYSVNLDDDDETNFYVPPINILEPQNYGGHAVLMVGWDDNYPKENFPTTPPGDGAIICKNSWGEESGEDGFIYISYYDNVFNDNPLQDTIFETLPNGFSTRFASFNTYDHAPDYNKIYQYDEYGMTSTVSECYGKIDYAVNVFPEEGNYLSTDEILRAVSFYSETGGTKYEIYLIPDFKSEKDADIKKSNAEKIASGKVDFAGYHVIDLDKDYILSKGTRFGIAVRLSETIFGDAEYPLEIASSGYSPNARSNRGESYYKTSNKIIDLYDDIENSNWCIKAFTAEKNSGSASNTAPNGFISNPVFGIDNQNRRYASNKVHSFDELISSGCKFTKEFLDYIANPSKYAGGITPSPVAFKNTQSVFSGKYPEKYDLRDYGLVTSVKNQGPYGTCWTFGATGSLESSALKNFGKNGIFNDVNIVEESVECVATVDQKATEKIFRFTSEDNALYSFNLSGGAFITEICSQFGVIHDTIRTTEFKLTLKENESVYFKVRFADADATGDISVNVLLESIIEEEEQIIRLTGGDTYSGTLTAGSMQEIQFYHNNYNNYKKFYYRISCDSELFIVDKYYNEIETNSFISEECWDYSPESIYIISTEDVDVDYTVEVLWPSDYYSTYFEDIGSATEHTITDKNIRAYRFTPDHSGTYAIISDNNSFNFAYDKNMQHLSFGFINYLYYDLVEGEYYYLTIDDPEVNSFRVIEWTESHPDTIVLNEDKLHLDVINGKNDVANHSFTAPEDGYYKIEASFSDNYKYSFDITDTNGNKIDVESTSFDYESKISMIKLSKDETVNISVKINNDIVDENNESYFITKLIYSIIINKSFSGISELEKGTVYDYSQANLNDIFKLTADEPGYYILRINDKNPDSAETVIKFNYNSVFNDELNYKPIRFLDGSYGTTIELSKDQTVYFFLDDSDEFDISFEIQHSPVSCSYSPQVLELNKPVTGFTSDYSESIELPVIAKTDSPEKTIPLAVVIESSSDNISGMHIAELEALPLEVKKTVADDKTIYTVLLFLPAMNDDYNQTFRFFVSDCGEFKATLIDYTPYDTSFSFDNNGSIIDDLINNLFGSLDIFPPVVSNYETRYFREEFTLPLQIGQALAFKQEDVIWKSTNEAVVTVDENGNFKCAGLGSSIVSAESPDGNYRCTRTIHVKYNWWQWLLNILTFGQIWK